MTSSRNQQEDDEVFDICASQHVSHVYVRWEDDLEICMYTNQQYANLAHVEILSFFQLVYNICGCDLEYSRTRFYIVVLMGN